LNWRQSKKRDGTKARHRCGTQPAAGRGLLGRAPATRRGSRGDGSLREACAERLRARGAEVEADDILIISGAQQALSLMAHCFVREGDERRLDAHTCGPGRGRPVGNRQVRVHCAPEIGIAHLREMRAEEALRLNLVEAGVGAGTLYRHFPTRDALIEAVYRSEVEKLAAAEREFAQAMPPIQALRAWMLLFVDYIAAKHIIAPALNTFVGGPSKLYESSRDQINGAINSLVKRAIKSGDIRKDLEPFDLLRALIGVSNVASSPDWQQSAKRLVDILITGSRPVR